MDLSPYRLRERTTIASSPEEIYDLLADGGEATQPLIETFFSPGFGMCTDRFGTPWMIVADAPETP